MLGIVLSTGTVKLAEIPIAFIDQSDKTAWRVLFPKTTILIKTNKNHRKVINNEYLEENVFTTDKNPSRLSLVLQLKHW